MTRIAILLASLLAALALAAPAAHAAQPKTSLPDVEDEVMCVTCNVPLYIAESPQASRERAFIRELIAQGLTKQQIKNRLVAEYGDAVLAMPKDDGIGLAAYLVPIAVVLALLAGAAVLLPRWRRRAAAAPAQAASPGPAATDDELARLDDDLKRYDRV